MGTWKPTDKPVPHSWFGITAKGGGNAGVGGEFAAAALLSAVKPSTGCTFVSLTGQAGFVAGVSGGIAFVFATGFRSANDFNNYAADPK